MEEGLNRSSHIKYRADVDGLRALAVILVVTFHAFPNHISSGFVGVDVFFVISGYLISTIIVDGLRSGTFSFIEFYSRRIRRIFPTLILVLLACIALGWFVLLAHEYKQLAKHVTGGATFLSNIILWRESGYFDNTAETKPLLHLWSLAIEEQFYVFWPLILWASFKARLNWVTIAVILSGISFFLNIKNISNDSVATFYSLQTRIWEILAGSILASVSNLETKKLTGWLTRLDALLGRIIFAQSPKSDGTILRNVASCVGASLILLSAVSNIPNKFFPGVWALMPVIGTVLVIVGGSGAWFNRKILANPVLVWFGLISFPLYLWHWPILSFARILEGQALTPTTKAVAVLISVVLAYLTYIIVEQKVRRGGRKITALLLVCMFLLACSGYRIHAREGLPTRSPTLSNTEEAVALNLPLAPILNSCGLPQSEVAGFICIEDSRSPPKYALLGDSKAEAIVSGLMRTSDDRGRWLFIGGGTSGKPVPVISEHHLYRSYQRATELAVKAIAENKSVETVVLVTATRILFNLKNDSDIEDLSESKNYAIAIEGLQNAISKFKVAKKKVVLLVDNPTLPHPEDCVRRVTQSAWLNNLLHQTSNLRCQITVEHHLALTKKYRDLLNDLVDRNNGDALLFDITNIMCNLETGLCGTKKNNKAMYSISDHVSEYAAILIGVELNDYLATLKPNAIVP